MKKIIVKNIDVTILKFNEEDYISLTDIARIQNPFEPKDVVKNWMRQKNTIEFLGLWEKIYNPNFKGVEFDPLLEQAGYNSFTLSPTRWIEITNAIGITSKSGRYGGTYAHKDIAFKFANWVSVEFELYLIKEVQRLKATEKQNEGWTAKRELARINYHIHTSAISRNLIPPKLTRSQINFIYASEADVLNMALFGITAQKWREQHPELQGNIRDYAQTKQLICLSNLENINSVLINDGFPQNDRLEKLNQIAIQQMEVLKGAETNLIKSIDN